MIDVSKIKPSGKVIFGTTVTLIDADSGDEIRYKIVGEDEADLKAGKISIMSPIARGIVGKEATFYFSAYCGAGFATLLMLLAVSLSAGLLADKPARGGEAPSG